MHSLNSFTHALCSISLETTLGCVCRQTKARILNCRPGPISAQSFFSANLFANPFQQFYQIIDMTTLGQKAVDVDTQRAASVEHSGSDPGFTTLLNLLLQL